MNTRVDAFITRTPCENEKKMGISSMLPRVFCGKQSLQVTTRPISMKKSRKEKLDKFENENFALVEMKCEKSLVSKLSEKIFSQDSERSDRSMESSRDLPDSFESQRSESEEKNVIESLENTVFSLY